MRRLAALLAVPFLLLACGGDEPDDSGQAATTTTETPAPAPPPGPPTDLCQELGDAIAAEDPVTRSESFGQLHTVLADADEEVHEALYTLERELENPDDGEALADAMETLNSEFRCGG